MAVLGRLLVGSAERLDLPDLLSIDSYTAGDFKYLLQSFVGSETPYILSGFDVIQPQDAIGTTAVSIQVANSVVYNPSAGAGSFFYGLDEGNQLALPLTPELRTNATNFIYLTFTTTDTARDSRAFWDPDQNGGDGGEFTQSVNTESALTIEVGVSVSSFPEGTVPVCKVTVDSSAITSIEDARNMMFRLGTGGANPDPFHSFNFREDPTPANARQEPSGLMTNGLDPNPFQGGDKNIFTLKEWMDVVMTRIKEISGETYWYEGISGNGITLANLFTDALGSKLWSKGSWQFTGATTDTVEWTQDIRYQSVIDPRQFFFRSSSIQLPNDGDIAWFQLVRDADINTTATPVAWANGVDYVNASVVGAFENLEQGDWIKKKSDNSYEYRRVEQFYSAANKGGAATTGALALSVELSSVYTGISSSEESVYSKGDYDLTDIIVSQSNDIQIANAGGNFYWMACRADTVVNVSSIVPIELTLDITEADGQRARVTETVLAGHGLIDGDRIEITTGGYAGIYQVEVESTTEFFIETSVTGDELGQTAYYALLTTGQRVSSPSPIPVPFIVEENDDHGLETNQIITISDTGSLYDGIYEVSVRSSSVAQIPYNAATPDPGTGTVEIPRIHVRQSLGSAVIQPGQTINFDDVDSTNILTYVGMESMSQTSPTYFNPLAYNALQGHQNYNSNPTDNLTERASKLTAMMADRVQERDIIFTGNVTILNESLGADQQITATNTIIIHKPSSPDQVIDLSAIIPANSVAVAQIDRDGGGAIALTIESLSTSYLLEENKLIMFYRFADTTVYDWNGNAINNNGTISTDYPEYSQNRNITVVNPAAVNFNPATELLTLPAKETAEISQVTVSSAPSTVNSSYFLLWSAEDQTRYYVWYNINALGIDPVITFPDELAGAVGIEVALAAADTATTVALNTANAITLVAGLDFVAGSAVDVVTITNNLPGTTSNTRDSQLSSTGYEFFTPTEGSSKDIDILIHGSANNNVIDTDAIDLLNALYLPNDHSIWIRIDRTQQKTFNTILTVDAPDTAGAGALFITPTTDVPLDQDVFVLWARVGGRIVELHKADIPINNIYEEEMEVIVGVPVNDQQLAGPVAAGTTIVLPQDSKNSNRVKTYVVGAGQLEVYLNGQRLTIDEDFSEVGVQGCESTLFNIDQPLVVGDFLTIRVETKGIVAGSGSAPVVVPPGSTWTHIEITNVLSPFAATTDDQIVADSTGGVITINLPVAVGGDRIRIIDGGAGAGSFGTNNLTIVPSGGATIQGAASSSLTIDGQWVELVYSGSLSDWRILG